MTIVEPGGASAGLIERVKNILIQPRAEWDKIATERTPLMALITGYTLPLVALAAIASFIGAIVFGYGGFGFVIRPTLTMALTSAVLQVVLGVIGVVVLGFVIAALAPTFASEKDEIKANQLAVYSATAGYIGGLAMIFPPLGVLAMVGGIYSLVLLYLGLPRLMKTPEDKRLPYFVTIIVVAIVAGVVLGAIYGAVSRPLGLGVYGAAGSAAPFGMGGQRQDAEVQGHMNLPGGGSIDLGQLQNAAKQMEQAAQNPQGAAAVAAVNADQLRELLPDNLPGGFQRTEVSTGSSGAMMGVANASGVYTRGDARIELSVTDLGAAGAFAAMAGAMGVQGTRESADGYERTRTVDGRMTVEELSRSAHTAKYSVVARQRIMISAEGTNVGPDDVHAAVNAVGVARAEALAAQAPTAPASDQVINKPT